jgi:predicted aspartyl protease
VSRFRKEPPKRDREDELNPVVLPEGKPPSGPVLIVPSATKGLVTEPLLTVEIGRESYKFVVDTGATVSLIKPKISEAQVRKSHVQARGVSGTNLKILGVQEIEFNIGFPTGSMTFIHPFVVCPLEICSAGILGLDFLQRVGAEISLTDNSLTIQHQRISLESESLTASASTDSDALHESVCGLITHDTEKAPSLIDGWEDDESCLGTVELAVTRRNRTASPTEPCVGDELAGGQGMNNAVNTVTTKKWG